MLEVGKIRIHLLNDAYVMVDGGGPFGLIPRSMWEKVLPPDDHNRVPQSLTCLLVQVDGRNILIDTGLGNKLDDKWRSIWQLERPYGDLLAGLARLGLQPEDIDTLIFTHLHADHAAGATVRRDDVLVPTFPNARAYVQRREYEDAIRPNERTRATYQSENFAPLIDAGLLTLLDGPTEFAPGVRGVVTPGHTPGHMSILFESSGAQAMFVCDLAAYAVNLERLAWIPSYDVEPLVSLETKRYWQQWALDTGALLIFPHEPTIHCGVLTLNAAGKPQLQPNHEGFV